MPDTMSANNIEIQVQQRVQPNPKLMEQYIKIQNIKKQIHLKRIRSRPASAEAADLGEGAGETAASVGGVVSDAAGGGAARPLSAAPVLTTAVQQSMKSAAASSSPAGDPSSTRPASAAPKRFSSRRCARF